MVGTTNTPLTITLLFFLLDIATGRTRHGLALTSRETKGHFHGLGILTHLYTLGGNFFVGMAQLAHCMDGWGFVLSFPSRVEVLDGDEGTYDELF
jgi:hypothetical protein